jgi:hypothetical protein
MGHGDATQTAASPPGRLHVSGVPIVFPLPVKLSDGSAPSKKQSWTSKYCGWMYCGGLARESQVHEVKTAWKMQFRTDIE